MSDNKPMEQSLALIEQALDYIKKDIKDIKEELDGKYVTQDQFEPVRRIVYGGVAFILIAVVGAVIALVVK